jgi:hypothetical protein
VNHRNGKGEIFRSWPWIAVILLTIGIWSGAFYWVGSQPPPLPGDLNIPDFRVKANSTEDTLEITPIDRTILWGDYQVKIRINDENSTFSPIETNSMKTPKNEMAEFTGIRFERGDELELRIIVKEDYRLICDTIIKAY